MHLYFFELPLPSPHRIEALLYKQGKTCQECWDAAATPTALDARVPVQHGSFLSFPVSTVVHQRITGLTLRQYLIKCRFGLAYEERELIVFVSRLPISTHRLVHNY